MARRGIIMPRRDHYMPRRKLHAQKKSLCPEGIVMHRSQRIPHSDFELDL